MTLVITDQYPFHQCSQKFSIKYFTIDK